MYIEFFWFLDFSFVHIYCNLTCSLTINFTNFEYEVMPFGVTLAPVVFTDLYSSTFVYRYYWLFFLWVCYVWYSVTHSKMRHYLFLYKIIQNSFELLNFHFVLSNCQLIHILTINYTKLGIICLDFEFHWLQLSQSQS